MKRTENDIQMILELEGVNAKGYGIIPQAVVFDIDLPIQSKALYAYFCSFLGSGQAIFPSRETILKDLKISKTSFYKALKPLLDNGYIKISKAKGFKNKNVYIICNNPKKVNCTAITNGDESESLLSIDGINANGFGIIPKLIMCDTRLSIKAKALIALLYSLAQSGACAYPHRITICTALCISKNVYYSALNQLIDCGYITVKQRHSSNGRFSVNDYILNSNPKTPCLKKRDILKNVINTKLSPCPENEDIIKAKENTDVLPCLKNRDIINSHRVLKRGTLPCPEKRDNNITIYNNISNISSSNHITSTTKIAYTEDKDEIREMIYELTDYKNTVSRMQECITSDEALVRKCGLGMKLYLGIVKALIEMLSVKDFAVYNKQTVKTKDLFTTLSLCIHNNSLKELITDTQYHFELVREKYHIHNPSSYIKVLLWQHIDNYALSDDWWDKDN